MKKIIIYAIILSGFILLLESGSASAFKEAVSKDSENIFLAQLVPEGSDPTDPQWQDTSGETTIREVEPPAVIPGDPGYDSSAPSSSNSNNQAVPSNMTTMDELKEIQEKQYGPGGASGGVNLPTGYGLPAASLDWIIRNLVMWLLGVFGFLAILSFLVSGIQYFLAIGDEKGAETAKRNMTWSIIGVIVGLSGFVLLKAIDAALRGYNYNL